MKDSMRKLNMLFKDTQLQNAILSVVGKISQYIGGVNFKNMFFNVLFHLLVNITKNILLICILYSTLGLFCKLIMQVFQQNV